MPAATPCSRSSALPAKMTSTRTAGNGRGPGIAKGGPVVIIDAEQSATIRDRLLAEIGNIASAELAASWAGGALAAKNQLAAVDAKRVEADFEQRLSELAATGASQ